MADSGREQLPVPVMPARGALAGVRSDVARSKDGSYNPVGTGSAWSHNFLNQKPWHPMNFRNQIRKYEAEQKAVADAKSKEQALAEWQAEQERVETMALLSPAEAQRQKDRAAISFMYQKPPGLDAALARDKEAADKAKRLQAEAEAVAAAGAEVAAPGGSSMPQRVPHGGAVGGGGGGGGSSSLDAALRERQQQLDRLREDPFAAILAARSALATNDKFVLRSTAGAYGGTVPGSENQLLLDGGADGDDRHGGGVGPSGGVVAGDDEAEALLASLEPGERAAVLAALEKKRQRADRAARLAEAQELLQSAGIDPRSLEDGSSKHKRSKHKSKHKRSSKKQHKKRHKKEEQPEPERGRSRGQGYSRGRARSSSSSSSSGSGNSDGSRERRGRRR